MSIEVVGKYQVYLLAYEVPGTGRWEAFVTIKRFDDAAQDFVCITEKHPVSDQTYASYDEAIEAARLFGNAAIADRRF